MSHYAVLSLAGDIADFVVIYTYMESVTSTCIILLLLLWCVHIGHNASDARSVVHVLDHMWANIRQPQYDDAYYPPDRPTGRRWVPRVDLTCMDG